MGLNLSNFDPSVLFVSLIVSSVGFVLFVYGRKQERWPQLAAGIVLLVYPYFVERLFTLLAAAVVILVALWIAVRAGW